MQYLKTVSLLMLLSHLACAGYISLIDLKVEETGRVSVNETISLSAEDPDPYSVLLPENTEVSSVYYSGGPLAFSVSEDVGWKNLTFPLPRAQGKPRVDVFIEYISQRMTSKSEGVWKLEFSTPVTASRSIIKIGFPRNSTILNWTPYRFSPAPDILYIYPDTFYVNFTATYQFKGGGVGSEDDKNSNNLYAYALAFAAFMVVLVYVLLKVLRRKHPETIPAQQPQAEASNEVSAPEASVQEDSGQEGVNGRELKESVSKMLEENELKVVDVLRGFEEEITQAQVYHTTGIPKASLSDIMNRLERRNIVERTREGRVKWVKLKKWVYK